jgi:oxygen-independent coproporphyrinogen-3 oxidase
MPVLQRFRKRLTEAYVYPEICKYQDAIQEPGNYLQFLDSDGPSHGVMIYVHIPFCETLCSFCNYLKVVFRPDAYEQRKELFKAYVCEIETYARHRYIANCHVRAVQFGGGTPSCIETEFIVQILDAIRSNFNCRFELVTMEGNVSSLRNRDKLQALKDAGIQRISFGVQTFNEQIRRKLHLRPTLADIFETVRLLNGAGFDDYSHDLMFNLPDQTIDDVRRDIEISDRKIRPAYLDCYNLNIMPNTMFSSAVQQDSYCAVKPSDQAEIAMMREIIRVTQQKGYHQVLSNVFSKKRDTCVLTTRMILDGSDVIGIGPSARGYLMRRAHRNIPAIEPYIERVNTYGHSVAAGNVTTSEEEDERKMVMLGNFTFVRKAEIRDLEVFRPQIDFLVGEGYACEDREYIRLTREGSVWPGNVSELFFSDKQRARRNKTMLHVLRNRENPYNQDRMGVSAVLYREHGRSAASGAVERQP